MDTLETVAYNELRPYAPSDGEAERAAILYVAACREAIEKVFFETGTLPSSFGVSLVNQKDII